MNLRTLFATAALAATGVLLAGQVRGLLADPSVWPPDDFVEYWAAAKLTLAGQNPYDGALLLPLQRAAGRDTDFAIMMWNPPWSLSAVLPLGLLPAREAQLLWLLVNLAATAFCADRLWLLLRGDPARRWLGLAGAFLFLPTLFALGSGQISPILLLGAVLFLECERRADRNRNWHYLAGAATVLVAIKPHLAYLLWAGLAADALARGRWRTLAGGALAGLACAVLPLAFDPRAWHQYADAMANRPPSQWLSPTLGTLLRLAFGAEYFRLQFVPVAFGLAWFAWYRWKNRRNWNWAERLPLVLLVSFATAPYGAWPFDMVLLLPAALALFLKSRAAWEARPGWSPGSPRFTVAALAAINIACLAMNLAQSGSFLFLWVAPAMLLVSSLHSWQQKQSGHAPPSTRLALEPAAVRA
jgi:hypothetical protein